MPTVFEERTRDCQTELESVGSDCAVLFPSPNLYYVSGFMEEPLERHLFLFVPKNGDPIFVAPAMYGEQIQEESWISDIRTWKDGGDPMRIVSEVVSELGLRGGDILVDDKMWTLFTQDLREVLGNASFGLASLVFDELRMCKDEKELDAMRKAGTIADTVSEEIRNLGESAIGMTEREVAREIEQRMYDHGGEEVPFDIIVGSGPKGAQPHYRHGDREIKQGEPVVLDFGTRVDHYPSDQTRTVVFAGDPPDGFKGAYEAVLEAHETGVEAVQPGVEAQEIDRKTREVIEHRGYGEEFIHRTGHEVGLEVHEAPYIVEGNDTILEPGMVFSVEPGVYIEGEYGVRIEDLVAVTDDGYERLNNSPRTWRPL